MNAPRPDISDVMKPAPGGDRSIGAILVDSGKLRVEQAEQILRLQQRENLRFGDAALKLGLVSAEDIEFALARQYGYVHLRKGEGNFSAELVAAYEPHGPQVEALRALRSQLMLRWFTEDSPHRALAIVSPGRGEGRSYVTANLAVVFSQLGQRTLVIDADMRAGRQHAIFNLPNRSGLSTALSGRIDPVPIVRLPAFVDLSVLTSGPIPPNPQELLGREAFSELLHLASRSFDVILIDSAAGAVCADAQTVAARAGGAVMVVRQHRTSFTSASKYAANFAELGTTIVGSVINRF